MKAESIIKLTKIIRGNIAPPAFYKDSFSLGTSALHAARVLAIEEEIITSLDRTSGRPSFRRKNVPSA